ncbi:MAG: hypothetical protein HYY17_05925 [Planctomycetes bacterium]|nr:hypothetical protein [Planctomycetota bacterium]
MHCMHVVYSPGVGVIREKTLRTRLLAIVGGLLLIGSGLAQEESKTCRTPDGKLEFELSAEWKPGKAEDGSPLCTLSTKDDGESACVGVSFPKGETSASEEAARCKHIMISDVTTLVKEGTWKTGAGAVPFFSCRKKTDDGDTLHLDVLFFEEGGTVYRVDYLYFSNSRPEAKDHRRKLLDSFRWAGEKRSTTAKSEGAVRFDERSPGDGESGPRISYKGDVLVVENDRAGAQDFTQVATGKKTYGDFKLTARLRATKGPAKQGNGIWFRGEGENFFLFNVTGDGRCALYIYDNGGYSFFKFVAGQQVAKFEFQAVKKDDFNELTVVARGDEIGLSINGETVGTIRHTLRAEGTIGHYVSENNVVEYSDFRIGKIE